MSWKSSRFKKKDESNRELSKAKATGCDCQASQLFNTLSHWISHSFVNTNQLEYVNKTYFVSKDYIYLIEYLNLRSHSK